MKDTKKIKSIAAMVAGVALIAVGLTAQCMSMKAHVTETMAINEYRDEAFVRTDKDEYELKYSGYGMIAQGELSYDEGGAADPIFGVTADSPLIVRISEMYQWVPSGDGFEKEWRAELIDTDDESHKNPASYPSNAGSGNFSAHSVKLGGLKISDELLAKLETRKSVETLPEVDARGFRTVGEYITNAADINAPEIGDVRIRYEYATEKTVTVSGMQRSEGIVEWFNDDDVKLSRVFEGILSKAEVIASYRRTAAPVVLWLLLPGLVAAVGGAVLLVFGFRWLSGYNPTCGITLKKKKLKFDGERAALIYGGLLGVIATAIAISASWAGVSAMWLVISIAAAVVFLNVFVPNIIKNTPKHVKPEAPYEPILRKRDEFKRK